MSSGVLGKVDGSMPKAKDIDSATGTSTDAGVSAKDWICGHLHYKTLVLKNTDGANSVDYTITVYADENGQGHSETTGTLALAGTQRIALNNFYDRVVITMTSTVPGSHGTFQVDVIGVTP